MRLPAKDLGVFCLLTLPEVFLVVESNHTHVGEASSLTVLLLSFFAINLLIERTNECDNRNGVVLL
jgi:hypothetical protein